MEEYSVARLRLSKTADCGKILAAGTVGAIVHLHPGGEACEFEVVTERPEVCYLLTVNIIELESCEEVPIHVIHTKGEFVLSKRNYSDWKAIQASFSSYVTSLDPMVYAELIEYLNNEYGDSWPIPKQQVHDFIYSSNEEVAI